MKWSCITSKIAYLKKCFFLNIGGYQNYLLNNMRLDSNIEHKSSNNDYLNITKFIFLLFPFNPAFYIDHKRWSEKMSPLSPKGTTYKSNGLFIDHGRADIQALHNAPKRSRHQINYHIFFHFLKMPGVRLGVSCIT